MIVNDGKLIYAQHGIEYAANFYMQLFTNNYSIVDATVLSALTLAGWAGYLSVAISTMTASAIVGAKAVTSAVSPCVFTNGSGSPVTYYGWAVTSGSSGGTLYQATNLGLQTLNPAASISFPFTLSLEDVSDV